ncbi:hypothetical protein PM082_008637 [Marasmius tenuissimus]|nr:hypothetical protein PM082_008637 [Marasmius tenuissimus]
MIRPIQAVSVATRQLCLLLFDKNASHQTTLHSTRPELGCIALACIPDVRGSVPLGAHSSSRSARNMMESDLSRIKKEISSSIIYGRENGSAKNYNDLSQSQPRTIFDLQPPTDCNGYLALDG